VADFATDGHRGEGVVPTGQYGNPVLISGEVETQPHRVPLGEGDHGERWLQALLTEHPAAK
jgi:hypothetical protein